MKKKIIKIVEIIKEKLIDVGFRTVIFFLHPISLLLILIIGLVGGIGIIGCTRPPEIYDYYEMWYNVYPEGRIDTIHKNVAIEVGKDEQIKTKYYWIKECYIIYLIPSNSICISEKYPIEITKLKRITKEEYEVIQ